MEINPNILGFIALRLGVAYVFLYAAWRNTQNTQAWTWTKSETVVLFRKVREPKKTKIAAMASVIGMVMMYGGGLSILLGLGADYGGLAIAVFSSLGMRIHSIRAQEAKAAGKAGDPMGWSAYSAHVAAGLKNVAFIGIGLFFLLYGSGPWALSNQLHWPSRIIDYFMPKSVSAHNSLNSET